MRACGLERYVAIARKDRMAMFRTGQLTRQVIDKKVCFQGRTIPRGNHFHAVRVYNEEIEP